MNRGVRQSQPGNAAEGDSSPAPTRYSRPPESPAGPKGLKIVQVVLLGCIGILILAAAVLMATSNNKNAPTSSENRLVDTSKNQAVFLNNGQVYFGKIGDLNKDYLTLSKIYYLRVNQQVQPGQQANQNDVTLAKLGCELHRPQDSMVINRDQVTFWENLKDDDSDKSVPGAIKKAKDQPEQNCDQPATTNTNSNTPAATTPTTPSNTTPTTNTPTTPTTPTTPRRP